jgi:hypothetical protein
MLYKFLKQNENEMEYYLSHPDRNVRLILTQTFNRNRQKSYDCDESHSQF